MLRACSQAGLVNNLGATIGVIAAATSASGLWVALDLPLRRPVIEQLA